MTETDQIVLEYSVQNNTGATIDTNPLFSWGVVLASPGNQQLNSLSPFDLYGDNYDGYEGFSVVNTANVTDASLFDESPIGATSFTFMGSAPYNDGIFNKVGYYFEVPFARSDIATVGVP